MSRPDRRPLDRSPVRRALACVVAAFSIAAACAGAPACHAAPIDTDGPDFVESSEVVGAGRFQFEAGLARERDRGRNVSRSSTPTLLRFGLNDSVEVRIETAGRLGASSSANSTGNSAPANATSDMADTAIGLKWHSQDRDAATATPAVSWILHADMPSGSGAARGNGVRPSLRSVITYELAHDWSLGLMPGIKRDTTARGERYTSAILGIVAGKRLSDKLRVFAELAAPQIARASNGGVQMSWDMGAAYLLDNDWQIGIRAAVRANRNTPDNAVLLALSGRF